MCSGSHCASHLVRADSDNASSDGAVVIRDVSVPLSSLLSPEARAYMIHLLRDHPFRGGPSETDDLQGFRAHQDQIMNGFLEPMRHRYSVDIESQTISGIHADVVTPKGGVSPKNRNNVLINVHGGGFVSGARTSALIESIPIAAIAKIKVITLDYRMWPENKFPAASEDVAEVYKEILKKYAPEHVGLYGCSAGGMLTGMSIAWFQKHQLPSPAAVGVLCASLGDMFAGDAAHLSGPLNGLTTPPRSVSRPSAPVRGGFGYLSDAEVRAGVDAELHVWDGLPHAFWYNSDLPESREAYDVIARFFECHLAN